MRFEVLKEGRSHRRWEYILKFDTAFKESEFVEGFNMALMGKEELQSYALVKRNKRYFLTAENNTKKSYAEFCFVSYPDKKRVLFSVRRLEIDRVRLKSLLENLVGFGNFNQTESQPCQNGQLDLFQLD